MKIEYIITIVSLIQMSKRTQTQMSGEEKKDKQLWVSATGITSVIMNDHFTEWYKLYGDKGNTLVTYPAFISFLFEQGKLFEIKVLEYLSSKLFPGLVKKISDVYSDN